MDFGIKYFTNSSKLARDNSQLMSITNGVVCSAGINYEIFDNFNIYFNSNFNKNSTNKFNLSLGFIYGF